MVRFMSRTEDSGEKETGRGWRSPQRWMIFPAALLYLAPISAYTDTPAAEEKEEIVAEIDTSTLAEQLGDESYQVRARAMQELWARGTASLPALNEVVEGKDPEVISRASELILYISAGVLPNSPEEIKELVIQFSRSPLNDKLTILRKLIDLSQWKQVLHLARFEKNPDAKAEMAGLVREAASKAAREAIVAGDFDLASEILELTGDDENSMAMRAWFYVRNGQFKEKLEKASQVPGKKGAVWRMSLHRANGDVKAAIAEAEKAGFEDLTAGMRVFAGQALPLLEKTGSGNNVDVVLDLGFQIQKAKLLGQNKKADIIARELSRMNNDDDTMRRAAICLAANGYRQKAVDLIIQSDVNAAFGYFDNIEMPHRSLKLFGISKEAELPYSDWVKEVTEEAINSQEHRERLLMLAGFLDRHGQGEHSLAVMRPLMKELEDGGEDDWFDLLTQLRADDLGWMAVTFAKERGNEDMVMDLSVKKILGNSDYVTTVWNELKKLHPDDINQALHELTLLAGIIPDTDNETDKVHKNLLATAMGEQGEGGIVKKVFIEALWNFAFKRNNAIEASRLVDILVAQDNERWIRSKVFLDAALHRWDKVEPVYAQSAEERPGDYLNLIKWCISLRQLGRPDAAAKAYDRSLMLTMGNAEALGRIGFELSEAGYEDEAVAIWEHSAIMASSNSSEYESAIVYLSIYGEDLYTSKQWQKAAAIHEVYTNILMRGRSSSSYLSRILRVRFYANFCHGMHLLGSGQREAAIKQLDEARQLIPGDGSLADHFFPVLRKAGVDKYYEQWFEDSYRHVALACEAYPGSHNSQNTAAWLASRAVRRLDDAHQHAEAALEKKPQQGAYLDTMAEVWFARGNRAKAIEWGEKAVAASVGNAQGSPRTETQGLVNFNQLSKQLRRFKKNPMPK